MAEPRLLVDQLLRAGAEVPLDENQARHIGLVLRLERGDILRVFNATDGEWRAHVSGRTKRGMSVRVEELLRPVRATPDLELLFAPVKRHATDLIVEKATELGVRRIRPVITQRTIAERVRLDRLQIIAREAAEQTERFDAPEIVEAEPLAKALDGWDPARALIYADEAGDDAEAAWGGNAGRAAPIMQELALLPRSSAEDAAADRAGEAAAKLALLIGPEGGFAEEERRMLRGLAFVTPVSLGPRILRAETAVIGALSVIQAAWGDWRTT
ncbi:MAG: 16S rRNA (uracil(1498)-N(3))-methyltransferase [Vitreimonas sp.]